MFSQPQKVRLMIACVSVLAAITFSVLLSKLNHAMGPPGPKEETHSSHSLEEKSQLVISGEDRLIERLGESIANAVATQLYSEHYNKHTKLEREAELVGLEETNNNSTSVTVKFLPSGDLMRADITVHNAATNDFDIKIDRAGNE